jgi:hypothetical protein
MRIRDPGLGMEKFGSGIGDGKNSDPGSVMKKFGSGIRDKHPRSATLLSRLSFVNFCQKLEIKMWLIDRLALLENLEKE